MLRTVMKSWVCVVNESDLKRHREKMVSQGDYIMERLWRQIQVNLSSEKIEVEITSVDEEAADGGYWRGSSGVFNKFELSWNDLGNEELICSKLDHEQLRVALQAMDMLRKLNVQGKMVSDMLSYLEKVGE